MQFLRAYFLFMLKKNNNECVCIVQNLEYIIEKKKKKKVIVFSQIQGLANRARNGKLLKTDESHTCVASLGIRRHRRWESAKCYQQDKNTEW